MKYPRVLVVSNNSFSLTNSNGRTLGNMFIGWPKKYLAELCISTDGANFDLCDNYYCISDKDILSAFLQFRKAKGHRLEDVQNEIIVTGIGGRLKTATMALARHILWGFNRWNSKDMNEWLDSYSPEVVLVVNGDSPFILSMARKISIKRAVPLIMFNTEGYCLFEKDWMYKDKLSWLCFPIYKRLLQRETYKTMRCVKYIIHGNQLLKDDYDKTFGVPSEVIYTGSDVKRSNKTFNAGSPKIVYLGNFGYNRPIALATVAKVLRQINPNFKIEVYGKPATDGQKYVLTHSEGILFLGSVPYSEVKCIQSNADILLHVEGFDDCLQESLRYGFSTKIADCLSTGKPFLLYSRPNIACAQYIKNTGAGWFASSEVELKEIFISLLNNKDLREKRLSVAKNIVSQNHNIDSNRIKFQNAIIKAIMSEQ